MKIPLKMLKDMKITSVESGDFIMYDETTRQWTNRKPQQKIWTGRTTVQGSAGEWTISFEQAGFTTIPTVYAQAFAASADRQGRNFASLGSVTQTSASGYSSTAGSSSLLGLGTVLMNSPAGTIIDIIAIGV